VARLSSSTLWLTRVRAIRCRQKAEIKKFFTFFVSGAAGGGESPPEES
jgi:hypothetical protein